MCSAYEPPENAGVWPDTPVQAGTRVEIYCFEGYEEDYDDYWPFQRNLPRADFDGSGKRFSKAAISTLRGTAQVGAAIHRLQHVADARAGGGTSTMGLSAGRGRIRHPDVAALVRAKAVARLRRRREDRARLAPSGLPVMSMDDIMAGSQKTVDAMVRSFVSSGDAGFQPGWSDKRLSYSQALGKEPAPRSSSASSSSSYALRHLETSSESAGQRDSGVQGALEKQTLDARAHGLDDKYGYAVKARLTPHLDEDYKYALLASARGADSKFVSAMAAESDSATPSSARRRLLAEDNAGGGGGGGGGARAALQNLGTKDNDGSSPRTNPMYRTPWVDKPEKKPVCLDSTL